METIEQPICATPRNGTANGGGSEAPTPPRVYIQTLADAYVCSAATGRDDQIFSNLLSTFEKHNGNIINTYFCVSIPAAIVLTEIPGKAASDTEYVLYLTYPFLSDAPPWLIELLLELNSLHLEVRQFAPLRDKRLCLEIIFSAASQMLRYMERVTSKAAAAPAAPSDPNEAAATAGHTSATGVAQAEMTNLRRIYEGEVHRARRFYQAVIMRKSQGYYFFGMIIGVVFIAAAVIGGLWLSENHQGFGVPGQELLIVSLVAGGIGAVVSVMQRMTNGSLNLLPNAEPSSLIRVGSFRPLLGGLIAAVAYALLASGLLPIKTPDEKLVTAVYFYVAFAFFAGFSERFAQDTLAAGQAGLTGRPSDPPSGSPAPADS